MSKINLSETARNLAQPILFPLVKVLSGLNVHPNAITILCFLGFVLSSFFIAYGEFVVAGILLLLFAPLDALDGALARFTNKVSPFGAFLDSTLDRYGEIFIFFSFCYYFIAYNQPYQALLSFLGITGSLMVSYTRARAEGVGFECKIGMFTRFERISFMIIALIFDLITLFLVVISVFTHLTAIQRILYVYKNQKRS
ncbi:CDP-alcohol phosphatidyltransferase family protein [Thermodesulfobacterium hveragerdense]|uniref:CDP-alcohol phosphatidyltransferase family protein n=1 Tax=Thermodesulfobacterium hveragerdense TaxID=53424 RepID=UPI0003FD52EA|nr:CDP-alcohol phosphatidyltransferase family protein [Thermodesulfobacterium hveragerdense]